MKKLSYKEFNEKVDYVIDVFNADCGTDFGRRLGDKIQIQEIDGHLFEEHKAKFGINWSALGTRSPEETVEFAKDLQLAAELAEELTALELVVTWN